MFRDEWGCVMHSLGLAERQAQVGHSPSISSYITQGIQHPSGLVEFDLWGFLNLGL